MRSKGYSSCPVCVSVCPQAILAVRAITNKTKDTIVLSVEFEAITKKVFLLNVWFETYLCGDGHFVLMCNLRAMFRILSVTRLLTCYVEPYYTGTKVISIIARVRGECQAWVRMCTRVRAQTLLCNIALSYMFDVCIL